MKLNTNTCKILHFYSFSDFFLNIIQRIIQEIEK
jgi:hypothetical protein